MAKYIEKSQIEYLIGVRDRVFPERNQAREATGIDVLDNDTLSSLSVYEIVTQYDADFNINFARNGEDGISNGVITEHKCSNIQPSKKGVVGLGAFQFHAMGKLDYPRYILTARRKDNLQLVRMYDFSDPANTKRIVDHLMAQRESWLAAGRIDPNKMKRDVITLPETLLAQMPTRETRVINNCTVFLG
jgi:hypothetical protein